MRNKIALAVLAGFFLLEPVFAADWYICLSSFKNRDNARKLEKTLEQNGYLHVLCRIMAMETHVSERYAKYVYFKQLANPEIFTGSAETVSRASSCGR